MITIEEIAEKVINRIKVFPEEAKQTRGYDSPKTVWDEYKEQIQYEEYDSFEILRETIDSMVDDEVEDLFDSQIESLLESLSMDIPPDEPEVNDILKSEILSCLNEMAESEEIEYSNTKTRFYVFYYDPEAYPDEEDFEDNNAAVFKVIRKTSPSEYLIHVYSRFTGPLGDHEVVDLDSLDDEYILTEIPDEKFEEIRKELFPESQSVKEVDIAEDTRIRSTSEKSVADDKDESRNREPIYKGLVSIADDGRISVSRVSPPLSAAKVDGVWGWGTFSPDDFKDNFRVVDESRESKFFNELLNEASSALASIPQPDRIPVY